MDLDLHSLGDEFRIRGAWWLPSRPEERIPGTLTYDPEEGVRLELDGRFGLPELNFFSGGGFPRSVRLELILGIDAEGSPYTLHKSDAVKISSINAFRVSYLLAGKHFQSVDELSFYSAGVQYSYLESWSCFQFYKHTWVPGSISIEIPMPGSAQFKTGAAGPIQELSLISFSQPHFTLGAVEVKPGSRFDIAFKDALNLRNVFSVIEDLGQLMTMLVGKACHVTRLWVCGSEQPSVSVFYASTLKKAPELHPLEMSFPLSEIENISALIEKWFFSLTALEPVYDLLFGTIFQRDAYVRTKFINLTQALESFHRRTAGGTYMAADRYLAMVERLCGAIPEWVPETLKRRLFDSLRYANEFSLRKRLKELMNSLDTRTLCMLKITDVADTSDLIVKTRNYLTHFDDESKTKLVDDIVSMYYVNERLASLLFILVLKRLGMQESVAAAGILKRRFFE